MSDKSGLELTRKLPWRRPEIRRMRAGYAEVGANPVQPEGIGFGS